MFTVFMSLSALAVDRGVAPPKEKDSTRERERLREGTIMGLPYIRGAEYLQSTRGRQLLQVQQHALSAPVLNESSSEVVGGRQGDLSH